MTKEIYIIRHGETELNKLRIIQGSGIDSSLNEKGRSQARAFYDFYKAEDFQFVYTSALKRTVQSVQDFLLEGIPYRSLSDINEISWGIHEGQSPNPVLTNSYLEVVKKWDAEDYDAALPQAESPRELSARLRRFVDELLANPAEKLLVCSHGRAIRCLMTILHDEPLKMMEQYDHSNTGLFKMLYKNGRFTSLTLNNTDHLHTEELRSMVW